MVATASALFIGTTRATTRSRFLFNWDSVNFALALERIDLRQHQPHPPASLAYVVAGRLIRPLVHDANAAFVIWNIIAAVIACMLMFAFAYHAAPRHRTRHGWVAWFVLAASVQFWFYADVAEVYMSELVTTLLVAFCMLRAMQGSSRFLYLGAAALAVAGAFRLTGMIFVLPLWLYAFFRAPIEGKSRAVAVFALVLAAWLVPVLLLFGRDYITLIGEQFTSATEPSRALAGGSLRSLNRNARDTFYSLVAGVGVFNVLAALVLVAARRRLPRPGREVARFLLMWYLPALSVFVLLHMGKFGYTLLLAPIGCYLVAVVYAEDARPGMLTTLVALQLAAGCLHFVVGHPSSGSVSGEGRPYGEKTVAEKFFTETNSIFLPTWHTIKTADRAIVWVRTRVSAACGESAGLDPSASAGAASPAVLVTTDGDSILDWRRAMYYYPAAFTVRLPRSGDAPFFVGTGHRSDVRDVPELTLQAACRTFWLLPAEHPALQDLRRQGRLGTISEGALTIYETTGPLTVAATPTRRLRID